MKRITVEMLKQVDACEEQLELFEQVFPSGAPVSMRSLMKAKREGLDVFFAERLLEGQAWAEYEKVAGQAWAEFEKVTEQAWAEFGKVTERAWDEYEKAAGQALVKALAAQGPAVVREEDGVYIPSPRPNAQEESE